MNETPPPKIHYKLDSALKTLKEDLVEERKKTHANPKIMYYNMGDNPEDPNAFKLEKSHDVYFSPVDPTIGTEEEEAKSEETKKTAALQASTTDLQPMAREIPIPLQLCGQRRIPIPLPCRLAA